MNTKLQKGPLLPTCGTSGKSTESVAEALKEWKRRIRLFRFYSSTTGLGSITTSHCLSGAHISFLSSVQDFPKRCHAPRELLPWQTSRQNMPRCSPESTYRSLIKNREELAVETLIVARARVGSCAAVTHTRQSEQDSC